MVSLSNEEHALVGELIECIAEAMDHLDDVDVEYANKTKLQKLLYLAIDEFDLPITYSWYLAGAVVPADSVSPTQLESAFDELPSPGSPSSQSTDLIDSSTRDKNQPEADTLREEFLDTKELLDTADGELASDEAATSGASSISPSDSEEAAVDPILFPGTQSSNDGNGDDPLVELRDRRDKIVDFYVDVLPNVWDQNTMRFLQNFYLEYAPKAYRDLYVQSTHFRTRLREIETVVAAHVAGDQPGQEVTELVDAAGLDISEMHSTIRTSDSLSPTFDGFVRGTDLIEDALMMVAQKSPDSFEREHVAVIRSLQEFFYYYVWRYPCLVISQETVTGPSASEFRTDRQGRLADFDAELDREAERFERELADSGLKPSYTDYPSRDDGVDECITELADQYLE